MDFQNKILSKLIQESLYDSGKTIGTAESCTGGRIAEAIIAVPGASRYFKGGIICYTDDIKERLLGVSHEVLQEQTAVCEEVAREMVIGACETLRCDYAIAITGVAGPGGATDNAPVGTIWIGYGKADDVKTYRIDGDQGRDMNLAHATSTALGLMKSYLQETLVALEKESEEIEK